MQASELESWPVFQDPDYCQHPLRLLPHSPHTPHSTKGANSHLLQYRKPSEQQPRPLLPLPSFLLQRCLDVKNSTRCVSDTTLSTLHELILHSSEVVLLTLF